MSDAAGKDDGRPPGRAAAKAGDSLFSGRARRAPRLPECLYVEVTNRCNARCQTCPRTHYPPQGERDLSPAEFASILGQAPALRRLVLHGVGEPLLNGDLPAMVAAAGERGIETVFNTNALLLDDERQAALARAGLGECRVSLDGADEAGYALVRPGSVHRRVVENVGGLIATRARLGTPGPRVSLWFTALRDTLGQLPDLVRLGARLGVDGIHVQRLVYFGAGLAVAEQSLHGRAGEEQARFLAEARRLAEVLGVSLSASGAASPPESLAATAEARPWMRCRRPWTSAYVTAEGDVLPCCFAPFVLRDCRPVTFGNLFRRPLADIWHGDAYRDFRRAFAGADPPPCCAGCGTRWSI